MSAGYRYGQLVGPIQNGTVQAPQKLRKCAGCRCHAPLCQNFTVIAEKYRTDPCSLIVLSRTLIQCG